MKLSDVIDYSVDSKNLIIVGTDFDLNEIEQQIVDLGAHTIVVKGMLEYEDLSELVEEDDFDDESGVYLAHVNDPNGHELPGGLGFVKTLQPFHTVDGIFFNGKLKRPFVVRVKEQGIYMIAANRVKQELNI